MAALGKSAKPDLFSLVLKDYSSQNGHLDSSNTELCLLGIIVFAVKGYIFSSIFGHKAGTYHFGQINTFIKTP